MSATHYRTTTHRMTPVPSSPAREMDYLPTYEEHFAVNTAREEPRAPDVVGVPSIVTRHRPLPEITRSIIPDRPHILPHQVSPHLQEPQLTNYTLRKKDGAVIGRLGHNPLDVMKFFLQHLSKPQLKVTISGSHEETYTEVIEHAQLESPVSVTLLRTNGAQSRGLFVTQPQPQPQPQPHNLLIIPTRQSQTRPTKQRKKKRTVHDFSFDIHLDNMISSHWSSIQSCHAPTIQDVVASFTSSSKPIRTLTLLKSIQWDLELLEVQIINAIRRTGYEHAIKVKFEMTNNKVEIKSDSIWNTTTMNVLCCPIFFIWVPLKHCCLKEQSHGWLKAWFRSVPQDLVMEVYESDIKAFVNTRRCNETIPMRIVNTEMLLQPY